MSGFDLTFSRVKSVSALWALADPHIAARIERAHHAAVADALRFIETPALFTRTVGVGDRLANVAGQARTAMIGRRADVLTGEQSRQELRQFPKLSTEAPLPSTTRKGRFGQIMAEARGFEPRIGLKPQTRLAVGLLSVLGCP